MEWIIIKGIMLPFVGTALGAASVFLMKKAENKSIKVNASDETKESLFGEDKSASLALANGILEESDSKKCESGTAEKAKCILGVPKVTKCVLKESDSINVINTKLQRGLNGFAAGIMMAASVWSLIIPAIEQSQSIGHLSFIPVAAGFIVGVACFIFLDFSIPHIRRKGMEKEGPQTSISRTSMMVLAIVVHNIPEGMAVGVVYSGILMENSAFTIAGAMALSLGIAIQNFPEGAIISLPMRASGHSRCIAFLYGVLSAVAELCGALLTMVAASVFIPAMPYLLSFAAGAMVYVVVEELIPEMSEKGQYKLGTITFVLGFVLMMCLDVALG